MSSRDTLDLLHTKATQLFYAGQYQQALQVLDQALAQVSQLSQDADSNTLVTVSQQLEQTSLKFAVAAIPLFFVDADSTIQLLEDRLEQSESRDLALEELLLVARYYQQLQQAEPEYAQLLQQLEGIVELKTQDDISPHTLYHLGRIQYSTGSYQLAEKSLRQASTKAEGAGNTYLQSLALRYLGLVQVQLEDLSSAMTSIQQAVKLQLEHNYLIALPDSCTALALLSAIQEREERAHQLLTKAIDISKMISLSPSLVHSYYTLGMIYQQQDQASLAKEHYLQAFTLAQSINYHRLHHQVQTHFNLASLSSLSPLFI